MFADRKTVYVPQGQYAISTDPATVMTTLLGTCVAACLFDPIAHIGGMNHFLLPSSAETHLHAEKDSIVDHPMSKLLSEILARGAKRHHLRAMLFGGVESQRSIFNIGKMNSIFAREFFLLAGVSVSRESLGGSQIRKVQFWPTSGVARQKFLSKLAVE